MLLKQFAYSSRPALLKAYPFAVGGITNKLNTPLHEACKHGAPIQVIELLIDRFPGALCERNAKGELPIDRARAHGKKVMIFLEKAMSLSTLPEDFYEN